MDDKDKDWAEQLQEGYDHLDKKIHEKVMVQCFRKL